MGCKTLSKFLKLTAPIEEKKINIEKMLDKDLKRAIKTAEVLGCILKNRVGSLEKVKLVDIFEEAMNAHLRIMSFFFDIIKDKELQGYIINYISERLEKVIRDRNEELTVDEMKNIARTIFWNLNFMVVYGLINKIVHSLGSDKLIEIVDMVYDKINTPASFLVKHGIYMWYLKSTQIDAIAKKFKQKDFSQVAEKIMKLMVVNHCYLHPINYKERQKIIQLLGIPRNKLPLLPSKK